MHLLALACKAAIAVVLLAAGGAKLADVPGFASSVRLFAPGWASHAQLRAVAVAIALGELAAGGASLSSPQERWINVIVLAIACGFVAVSVSGHIRHPGRACRCYGPLSWRAFGMAGICRAVALVVAAAAAMAPVPHQVIAVGWLARLGLLAAAALLSAATYTAAAAAGRASDVGWA